MLNMDIFSPNSKSTTDDKLLLNVYITMKNFIVSSVC